MLPDDEGHLMDRKSLKRVVGPAADFPELASDCVCFANGAGGHLLIGIEDGESAPAPSQRIEPALVDRIRKRVGELTVNVRVEPELCQHPNGGQYISLHVPRALGVASTSDGRYFLRVGDTCLPVVGDDVLRLATERPSVPWEVLTTLGVSATSVDPSKAARWAADIRASDRVKSSVKEKSDHELLRHYSLTAAGPGASSLLTNLGILLLGTASDRARLGTAPIVQSIRFDERGTRINKFVWDDHSLSPIELLDAIWTEIPDFRETYQLPMGMFRPSIPAYDKDVIRELLVNALVHRPYTQRGDIFLNLHPDRLEVVNPGRLPFSVTPQNILHQSRRRNDGLARVFHDLGLMEREGTGIDLLYERLLTSGRAAPIITEGPDSVHVTVPRRVLHPAVIRLLEDADSRYQLTQRERIALSMLAQGDGLRAVEFAAKLALEEVGSLRTWVARLLEVGLVEQTGRTQATRYFVPPVILQSAGLERKTNLSRVQPHRLKALILEDISRFPRSGRGDIHRRIGLEINVKAVSRALAELVGDGAILPEKDGRWRTYTLGPLRDGDHDR